MRKKTKKQSISAIGTIRVHSRGFGFLIPDERKLFPEDIFIPPRAIHGAVDGDSVEVILNEHAVSDKGPEGRVSRILKRGRTRLAGVIASISKKKELFAYVPLLRENETMQVIPPKDRELKIGDRIIIHVLEWGGKRKSCLGEMNAYIGHISDPALDTPGAIEEYELEAAFSSAALDEAKAFGTQVSPEQWEDREDLRFSTCFTIDPDTAKDFDDALSLTQDEKGNFHLGVHIADVSHYVKPGTALDKEAAQRCNSVYFPAAVLPMLPHELSSHLCSLKPQVNRLAISVLMTLDPEGTVMNYRICKSVIRSSRRFTYKEAKEILDGNKNSKFSLEFALMKKLCGLLKKKRYMRGSIEFALPDLSIELMPNGDVKKIELLEYDISHQLVEEFMLLANEVVATHLSKEDKPVIYRIHEAPHPDHVQDFVHTASSLGFRISSMPTTEELQRLFEEAKSTAFGQFLATAFIRSMRLACYSTQNIGHYGLGLEYYTHFTSPIRRYVDLMVHRALFNENSENKLDDIAARCSDKERLSAKAETSVLLLKKLRFLLSQKQLGHSEYDAVILSVKPFGCFFELKELMFEGFLSLRNVKIPVGSKVKVKLINIDLVTRNTEWLLLKHTSESRKKR